jgi:hypothetical protein
MYKMIWHVPLLKKVSEGIVCTGLEIRHLWRIILMENSGTE